MLSWQDGFVTPVNVGKKLKGMIGPPSLEINSCG